MEFYVKLLIICILLVLSKVIRKSIPNLKKKQFLIHFNTKFSYALFSVPFNASVTYRH